MDYGGDRKVLLNQPLLRAATASGSVSLRKSLISFLLQQCSIQSLLINR